MATIQGNQGKVKEKKLKRVVILIDFPLSIGRDINVIYHIIIAIF